MSRKPTHLSIRTDSTMEEKPLPPLPHTPRSSRVPGMSHTSRAPSTSSRPHVQQFTPQNTRSSQLHTPPTPHTDHPSSLPTTIQLTQRSTWKCYACDALNPFEHTSAARPLGTLKCRHCLTPASIATVISDLSGFAKVEQANFMLSMPPGSQGPPQSTFGWICCRCGRSHAGHAEEKQAPKEPSMPKTPLGKRLFNAAYKLAHPEGYEGKELAFRLFHGIKDLALNPEEYNVYLHAEDPEIRHLISSSGYTKFAERRMFKVRLSEKCKCTHEICDRCLRFKVVVGGEWVAQEVAQEVGDLAAHKYYEYEERRNRVSYYWPGDGVAGSETPEMSE